MAGKAALPHAPGRALRGGAPHLSQDEGHHVRGLPVAGVEEVWQGHGGEGRQDVGAVQGVVDAPGAPPPGCDCGRDSGVRTVWPAWAPTDAWGHVGPKNGAPGLPQPLARLPPGRGLHMVTGGGRRPHRDVRSHPGTQGLPVGRRNTGERARAGVEVSLGQGSVHRTLSRPKAQGSVWTSSAAPGLPSTAALGRPPQLPTRRGPEDLHSPWEAPTGARLSEDAELSLWELSWLVLRSGRWARRPWGDEEGASGSGGLSRELPSRKRGLWARRASAAGVMSQSGRGPVSPSPHHPPLGASDGPSAPLTFSKAWVMQAPAAEHGLRSQVTQNHMLSHTNTSLGHVGRMALQPRAGPRIRRCTGAGAEPLLSVGAPDS